MVDEMSQQRRSFVRGVGAAIGGTVLGAPTVAAAGEKGDETGTANGDDQSKGSNGRPDRLRTCSFNVLHKGSNGEHPWEERLPRVVGAIEDVGPDLLGVQETRPVQFDQLRERLDGYRWHGVGRENGEQSSEMVPVAWRKDRFETVEKGAFWLSETPEKPSVGWDADHPRVVTWVSLRHGATGRRLWFCNTHVTYAGDKAQRESARLLRNRARKRSSGEDVVVAGDFNFEPKTKPYQILLGTKDRKASPLVDGRRKAGTDTVSGPEGTYHGFSDEIESRFDYLLAEKTATVEQYRTLPIREDGYRSDHLPVVADVSFAASQKNSG
jgi:endonuclease/exonuclease/phosphatase family metal-dependent hydrolase